MQIVRGFKEYQALNDKNPTVLTIGNFDGVHLGHQELIKKALDDAHFNKVKSIVYTFEPHPVRILRPELSPPRITLEKEKLKFLEKLGVDICLVEPFTHEYAQMSALRFMQDVLVDTFHIQELVVGYDFTFGQKGLGNIETLKQQKDALGFKLEVVAPIRTNSMIVSSTKVREFILGGKVEGASMLLGRTYSLTGKVVHGDGRGKQLGFPTANILSDFELLPLRGVYAAKIEIDKFPDTLLCDAVVNIGLRPTVNTNATQTVIEAHIFDFNQDIYNKQVRLYLISRLRDELRFLSLENLKNQIEKDCIDAKLCLAKT